MARHRRPDPITGRDLNNFVANNSDFAFEMRVLAQMRESGFECRHGGTYVDPVSGKIRQFDIRAVKNEGQLKLALAVECKNIRPNHPLLLSAVPRTAAEAFHHRIQYEVGTGGEAAKLVRREGRDSAYSAGEMVGKKTDQVRRENTPDGALVSDDSATFDKLNQAVNSCRDLVSESVFMPHPPYVRVIVPVLVVPANVLWQVDYLDDGKMVTTPRTVSRATLFIGHSWSFEREPFRPISYCMSHLDIITFDALPTAIRELTNLLLV